MKKLIPTFIFLGIICLAVYAFGSEPMGGVSITDLTDKYDLATEIKAIYELDGATLKTTPKDDPKDRIEVWIGEKTLLGAETNFEPKLTIARWDSEVEFSIKPKAFESVALNDRTIKFDKEKTIFETPKIDYHLYEIDEAFEYEVILKEKPATNVIEFTLEDKGLDFYYQPELTQEEIDEGAFRPENVIGSYAVYASEEKTNWTGGKEYKTGKVGHFYRPRIIDSVGTEVWGDLHIENGILSVAIPQEFLDKAIYPIRHAAGLTFGYNPESNGGTEYAWTENRVLGYLYNLSEDATATSISLYCAQDETGWGTMSVEYGLYSKEATNVFRGSTAPIEIGNTDDTMQYREGTIDTDGGLTAGDIFIAFNFNHAGGKKLKITYDAGDTNYGPYDIGPTIPTWPDPLVPDAYLDYKIAIYTTYTASGASDTCTPTADEVWKMDLQDHCTTTASFYSSSGMECYNQSGGGWTIAEGVEVRVASSTNCIPNIRGTAVFSIQPNQ